MKTASIKLMGGTIFCLLLLCAINYVVVRALENPYPWTTGNPTFSQLQTYTVNTGSPAPADITGNGPDCNNDSFIWRPEKFINFVKTQNQASINVCSFKTSRGLASTTGYGLLNGTKVAGRISGPAGDNGSFIAIPNSDNAIELTSSSNGSFIKILDSAYSGLQVIKNTDGSVAYKIVKTSPSLRNKNNQLISIQLGTLSYSDDGSWMIVDAPGTGLLRINVKTHEILPFANSFVYGGGSSPALQTAISNDGRYAVVASFSYNSFNLYDLSSCTAVATSTVYNCQSRNLQSITKSQVPTLYGSAEKIRFISDDTFTFYATYDRVNTNNRKVGLFSFTTPEKAVPKMDYLAMGDSFASGEGAFSYRDGTDIADNHCHQSELSYPYLLDLALSTGLFKVIACSGAKIKDIVTTKTADYNNNDPQGKNKRDDTDDPEIYNNYLPGYRAQLNFVAKNAPNIITISTGGNDIGFSAIIQNCVTSPNTCYKYRGERQELVHNINNIYPGLVDMYRSIKKDAAQNAKIYVIGYPQIAQVGGNCAVNVHFDNDEIIFGKQLISYLNSVIKMAANGAGVAYIDTEESFNGHKLCETSNSNVAVNGLTAGNSAPLPGIGPLGSESYHPNQLGHRLFANTIAAATNDFNLAMPGASGATPVFAPESSLDFLTSAPTDNREVWDSHYSDSLSDNAVIINQAAKLYVGADEFTLKPNSTFSVLAYSTPTNVGTVTSDENGEINSTFTMPGSLEPGYHTLHVRGEAITGEKIDIQKIVFVAASEADLDGDGTPNNAEACVIGEASGLDTDKDGIDDACDAVISDPPVDPVVEPNPVPLPDNTPPSDKPAPPTDNPQPTEPTPLPDPVDPQTDIPADTPILPPVEDPAPPPEPIVVVPADTTKILIESESNPQWLLDLTAQKQAELNARLAASAAASAALTAVQTTGLSRPQTAPAAATSDAPSTTVAGITTAEKNDTPVNKPLTYTKQTPEFMVMAIALGLLSIGALLVLWRLNKNRS